MLIDKHFISSFLSESYSLEKPEYGLYAKFFNDGQLEYFAYFENGKPVAKIGLVQGKQKGTFGFTGAITDENYDDGKYDVRCYTSDWENWQPMEFAIWVKTRILQICEYKNKHLPDSRLLGK